MAILQMRKLRTLRERRRGWSDVFLFCPENSVCEQEADILMRRFLEQIENDLRVKPEEEGPRPIPPFIRDLAWRTRPPGWVSHGSSPLRTFCGGPADSASRSSELLGAK